MHTSSLSNPRLCAIISWLPFSSFPSPFGPFAPPTPTARNPPTPFLSPPIYLSTHILATRQQTGTHTTCVIPHNASQGAKQVVQRGGPVPSIYTHGCAFCSSSSLARRLRPVYSRRLPFAALGSLRVRFGKAPASGDSRLGKVVN